MKSYKSLITANKVLEELVNSEALEECRYHSFFSGSMGPSGFCGYVIYGKCVRSTIKVIFYGVNKDTNTPIHIFISVDGKSKVRDKQFSIEDAIEFIITKVSKFIPKVNHD